MKNLLLILPLSFSMSVALAQSSDMKPASAATLDGKSFKITMTQRTSSGSGEMEKDGSYNKDSKSNKMNESSDRSMDSKESDVTGTTETTGTVAGSGNVDGKTSTTTKTKTTQGSGNNMEMMSDKKMILRFDHGSINSSALTMHGISTCPYTLSSSSGTMHTFSANCSSMSSGMGSTGSDKTNPTPSGTTGTSDTYNDGAKVNPATGTPAPGTPGSGTTVGTDNTRTSTTSGTVTGSGTSAQAKVKTGGTVQAMWSGTVDGNDIRGNFTWTNENGQSFYYTFTGSKASQKELDEEQELGSR